MLNHEEVISGIALVKEVSFLPTTHTFVLNINNSLSLIWSTYTGMTTFRLNNNNASNVRWLGHPGPSGTA